MALEYLGNIKYGSESPVFPKDSNGIEGFFSGYASGAAAREARAQAKEDSKNEADVGGTHDAQGNNTSSPNVTSDSLLGGLVHNDQSTFRKPGQPSFMSRLASTFLGARGEVEKGADPLFEVRKLTLEQSAQMNALTIKQKLEDRQRTIEAVAATSDFGNMLDNALKSPDPTDPAIRGEILSFMGRHPFLKKSEGAMDMLGQFNSGVTDFEQARTQTRLAEQYKMQFGPEGSKQRIAELNAAAKLAAVEAQQGGAMDRTIQQGDDAFQRELLRATRPGAATRTPGGVTAELVDMARAKNDEADAIANFDEAGAERLRFDAAQLLRQPSSIQQSNQIKALADKQASGAPLTPGETEVLSRLKRPTTEVYSENLITGQPEVRRVEGRVISPVDLKERVEGLRKNTDALGILDEVERKGGTDFVGVKPALETLIYDQILPQLGLNTANERRIMSKSDFVQFVQRGIRSLNAEARLSNQDATMLQEAFPQLDKWLSSPAQAKGTVKALRRGLATGAVRDAKAARRGVPPVAGDSLYMEDWFELERSGSLTHEEAVSLAARYKAQRRPPAR